MFHFIGSMDKIGATRLETNSNEERRKPRKLVNFPGVVRQDDPAVFTRSPAWF